MREDFQDPYSGWPCAAEGDPLSSRERIQEDAGWNRMMPSWKQEGRKISLLQRFLWLPPLSLGLQDLPTHFHGRRRKSESRFFEHSTAGKI